MSLIAEILLVISSRCRAASLLRWLLSFICPAARAEMLSVCRALSVFCSITACISCIEEETSSAEEACWLAPSANSMALALRRSLAREMELELAIILPIKSLRLSLMLFSARASRPISSSLSSSILVVKSPAATLSAMAIPRSMGRLIELDSRTIKRRPNKRDKLSVMICRLR